MRNFTRFPMSLALIITVAACRDRAPEPTHAAAAPRVQEGYVNAADSVRLYYRMTGAGGDTLVAIHGGPGFNLEYFAADLEPLAERHTLVFYDQRGAGRSTLVRDSAALDGKRFADDLEAVRRHFGLETLNLLGHSWGAGVVALYAARYPERIGRLVIVGGIPLERQQLLDAFEHLDAGRDSATRSEMQKRYEARLADPGDAAACRVYYTLWFVPFYGDSSAAGRTRGDFCAGSPEARRNKIESVDRYTVASLGNWAWHQPLRSVTAPTLVIHGSKDPLPLDGARDWATTLPNARLLLLEEIGHFPYLEAPEQFFPAVEEFLAGGWPEGAQGKTRGHRVVIPKEPLGARDRLRD